MHDLRVFRNQMDDRWWVAQVLTSGGFGWGGGPVPTTEEGVYFTELGEFEAMSLVARMPPGTLNRASHRSLLEVLLKAEKFTANVPLTPANVPSAGEFDSPQVPDDEGLRWVYRERTIPLFSPSTKYTLEYSVEFVCLDDTALRGAVRMSDESTFRDLVHLHGNEGLLSLIVAVKESFPDVVALAP